MVGTIACVSSNYLMSNVCIKSEICCILKFCVLVSIYGHVSESVRCYTSRAWLLSKACGGVSFSVESLICMAVHGLKLSFPHLLIASPQ